MTATEPILLTFDVDIVEGEKAGFAGYYYPAATDELNIVQVLMHGGTYDHRYWDAPEIDGHAYSYARYMAERGYAVVAVDQLGTGASWHPGGDDVKIDIVADGLAQVMGQLRDSAGPAGRGFDQVVLVGHSIGTIVSVFTQATHHPADVLVTTGLGHVPPPTPDSPFGPGVLEAELANEYVSLPCDARERAFYYAAGADPHMIAYDNEQLRTHFPRGLLLDALAATAGPEASRVDRVTGSVYVQLGEYDLIGPAALAGGEKDAWTAASDVTVETIAGVGHCFNLHRDNESSWRGVDRYLRARFR